MPRIISKILNFLFISYFIFSMIINLGFCLNFIEINISNKEFLNMIISTIAIVIIIIIFHLFAVIKKNKELFYACLTSNIYAITLISSELTLKFLIQRTGFILTVCITLLLMVSLLNFLITTSSR